MEYKHLPQEEAVYVIKNTVNDMMYIGHTSATKGLRRRIYLHQYDLMRGQNSNKPMQDFYNKHKDCLYLSCYITNHPDLEKLEEELTEENYDKCWNVRAGMKWPEGFSEKHIKNLSESHKGYIPTKEQRLKISIGNTGKVMSEKAKNKIAKSLYKPVIQLTEENVKIAEFGSLKEAFQKTQITNISAACRGVRPLAGGFKWTFKYA